MFTSIGKYVKYLLDEIGGSTDMLRSCLFWLWRSPFEWKQAAEQSVNIGVDSFGVTALTSLSDSVLNALSSIISQFSRAPAKL